MTRDGFPLGYEVFAGNRVDVTTVEEIVDDDGAALRPGQPRLGDGPRHGERGEHRLAAGSGRHYRSGTPGRSERSSSILPTAGLAAGARRRRGQASAGPDGDETFVLCRSTERREGEGDARSLLRRIEKALARLKGRSPRPRKTIDRGARAADRPAPRAQLPGRARTRSAHRGPRHPRVSASSGASEWDDWARGAKAATCCEPTCDWTTEELWRTYIQLTEAEAAFRIQKSELALRPIWHQREDRVQAHILVCFLAYVLWKTLEQWQSRAGLGNSPRTLLDELGAIHSADVVLPTATVPTRAAPALCGAARPSLRGAARPARPAPPRTAAHAHRRTPNVVPNLHLKPLKTFVRTPETAEVGLAPPHVMSKTCLRHDRGGEPARTCCQGLPAQRMQRA